MLTRVSGSMDGARPAEAAAEVWTTRALFARHKVVGISALALLLLLLVIVVGGLLAASPVVVNDATTCSTWSSANQTEQQAYGRRYLSERGSVSGGPRSAAGVVSAINAGCTQAFDNDVQDDITVVKAIQQ
jgi:hypothetical protein